MIKTTIIKPTVRTLKALLESYPDDMPVRIKDTDTGWMIDTFHLEISEYRDITCLEISSEYHEINSKWEK